jgi:hypothetical protein
VECFYESVFVTLCSLFLYGCDDDYYRRCTLLKVRAIECGARTLFYEDAFFLFFNLISARAPALYDNHIFVGTEDLFLFFGKI